MRPLDLGESISSKRTSGSRQRVHFYGKDVRRPSDNKTAVAFLAWLLAWAALGRAKNPRRWMAGAAIVTLAAFLIPHSVLGSELDYSKMPAAPAPTPELMSPK